MGLAFPPHTKNNDTVITIADAMASNAPSPAYPPPPSAILPPPVPSPSNRSASSSSSRKRKREGSDAASSASSASDFSKTVKRQVIHTDNGTACWHCGASPTNIYHVIGKKDRSVHLHPKYFADRCMLTLLSSSSQTSFSKVS